MYNIDPKIWGKYWWNVIHYTTIAYPENPSEEDQLNVTNLIFAMAKTLPCENCREHFAQNILILPLTSDILQSRYKLINWGVALHNLVNKQTGKPEMLLEDAIKLYTHTKPFYFNINLLNIIALLVVILIILFLYR